MYKIYFTILILFITLQSIGQSAFQRVTVNTGSINLSVSNAGTFGDPSMSGNSPKPSMQYPNNSGIEHLFESGLWIGAIVNGQPLVSTASVDAAGGYVTGSAGFEFSSNLGSAIKQRSTLTSNEFFSNNAISHQDYVLDFTDKNTIVPGTSTAISGHTTPLHADVHLETYAWNYGYADYFVIANYTITNNGTDTWDSVFVGNWSDLVIRNVNTTTATGTAFFNKGAGGWIDSSKAVYAYDYNGDLGYTNSYGAILYLGSEWNNLFMHPDNTAAVQALGFPAPKVNINFWRYKDIAPVPPYMAGYPTVDIERYNRMALGANTTSNTFVFSTPDNRTQLISNGPFQKVLPGGSINYVIAYVCAPQLGPSSPHTFDDYNTRQKLIENIKWAQRTYKGEDVNNNGILDAGEDLNNNGILNRFILPSPPDNPTVKIIPGNGKIDIYWDAKAEATIDPISKIKDFEGYKLYRNNVDNKGNTATSLVSQWDLITDSIGYNNGFSVIKMNKAKQFDGDTTHYWYHYEMNGLLNGWKYEIIVTAFDKGDKVLALDPLESSLIANTAFVFPGTAVNTDDTAVVGVYPNPYTLNAAWDGSTAFSKKINFYNLPAQCTVTIYNLSGDIVASFNHDATSYVGENIDWYKLLGGDAAKRILPGGEHSFDLLTEAKQSIVSGLYLFSVKNNSTKNIQKGTFSIIR